VKHTDRKRHSAQARAKYKRLEKASAAREGQLARLAYSMSTILGLPPWTIDPGVHGPWLETPDSQS